MTNKELDILVHEYRKTDNIFKKNTLFIQIASKYRPYIDKRIKYINDADKDDVLSIYHERVITAIAKWEAKSSFSTFMYSYIRGVIDRYISTINKHKKQRNGIHINVEDIDLDEYNLNLAHKYIPNDNVCM